MRKKLFVSVLALLSICLIAITIHIPYTEAATPVREVSVKLKNHLGNQKDVKVSIKGTYVLTEDNKVTLTSNQSYTVRLENNQLNLYRDSSRIASSSSSLTVTPSVYGTSNVIEINERPYLGSITFTKEDGYVRPVNKLPLEDYLKGVVPHEMPASWNVEALKAQAVAARTYALGHGSTIIDDTIRYQVYGGYFWGSTLYRNSNTAVEQTADQVLRYNGKLISAVYSSSNGGHTESNSNYWGSTQVPYLDAKPDSFDPVNKWAFSLDKQQIDTTGLDLANPDSWWNSVSENRDNRNELNNIKSYINSMSDFRNTNLKIVGIPTLSITNKNTSGKSTKGSIQVDYFVRNSDGSYRRENGATLSSEDTTTLSGATRYETSVAVAKEGWNTSSNVIIGRGDLPVDALAGSVLADKLNAPLLLTDSAKISSSVLTQIKELKASTVYLLGGTAAIDPSVQKTLETNGLTVERISGSTRYGTSVTIAEKVNASSELIITSGSATSPDALSIASYAASQQIPILLTEAKRLSSEVKEYVKNSGASTIYVIGGTAAVSDNVIAELKALGISSIKRISGSDRYRTSLAIADEFSFDKSNVFLARGDVFIDALPGAVLAAQKGAPVILTQKDAFPSASQAWLKQLESRPHMYYLGGEQAISTAAKNQIHASLLGDIKKYTLKLDNVNISTLRSLIGGSIFKSYHIDSVTDQSGRFTVNGRGFGHAVGMSQYGANERAKAGHQYNQILEFYYPKTSLGK
ncbi:SpoIID/LytB domain-containing protein [Bacillus suaedae]|uniref:SpoIID/LytB domain-containing protein n=1 Tax=Halalkalibacter suaedae TaxID=2822140 RepID=A0A940WPQ4_9BACI|nr:SpoIID/LytB domain-containing protein [Bacillus suaedae]MBP3950071.1 SpoIID/LytB domain-containing protein [Bacillus suaedae]